MADATEYNFMSLLFDFNVKDKFIGGTYIVAHATTQMSLILSTHLKK